MVCKMVKVESSKYMLVFSMLLTGCINLGCAKQTQKFAKEVNMPAESLTAGMSFRTKADNCSIDIKGSDVTDCSVTAEITVYAPKVKNAQEAAEQTKLNFEKSDKELVLKISSPDNLKNRTISVNLEIILPNRTDLNLESHNGDILINNIEGDIKVITYNGNVSARDISGNINFLSHNGLVNASFGKKADPNCNITMETYNGSIDLLPPPNYSARANIFTYNGTIDTSLPVTVTGLHSKNSLIGIINDDKNELKLHTHNGAITIRQ
jgi:hypothetical protein